MNINEFITKLEAEFEGVKPGSIKPESGFRDVEGWSSMHALIIIALVDTEYGVILSGDDIKGSVTVNDLYNVVLKKVAK